MFCIFQNLLIFPKRNTSFSSFFGKAMVAERKDVFPTGKRLGFPGKRQKERMNMKSNNQINIPQAREAMDRFKMQAAQDEDVLFTS